MLTRLIVVIALAAGIQATAIAEVFCVSNGADLVAALETAQDNGQNDVIRIETGEYIHPAQGGDTFSYKASLTETFDIVLSGGWSRRSLRGCDQISVSARAMDTAISGGNSHQVMNIETNHPGVNVTISLLTFKNGNGGVEAGGLSFPSDEDNTGTILIDQSAFIGNFGGYASALKISTKSGTVRLRNSLFKDNVTNDNSTIGITGSSTGSGKLYISNITMINNSNSSLNNPFSGMYVFGSATAQAFIVNNNLWDNEGTDLVISDNINAYLFNNNFQSYFGTPVEESGNISVTPLYQTGELNYTPANSSPLIDAGIEPPPFIPFPPSFKQAWQPGESDVFSRARNQGVTIDIGAYESSLDTSMPEVFADGFESP